MIYHNDFFSSAFDFLGERVLSFVREPWREEDRKMHNNITFYLTYTMTTCESKQQFEYDLKTVTDDPPRRRSTKRIHSSFLPQLWLGNVESSCKQIYFYKLPSLVIFTFFTTR